MQYFSKMDEFDFLIITGPEFKDTVANLSKTFTMNIKIQTFDFTTIFQAACARLFIFEYPEIEHYEKILYLDTDIILKADITPIFHLDISDLLYGIQSGTIGTFSFGAQFFDLSKVSEATPGINSGTLLFKNSQIIKDLFLRIRGHIDEFTESGQKVPYCMDQPFINYHAIKDSLYDNSLLNPHVSLFEGNDEVNNYETSSVCHFSFPIGNFGHKYARMKKFLDKIIGTNKNPGKIPDIMNKKYSWSGDNKGFIIFKENYAQTIWGKAVYEPLDTHIILAHWNNYYHLIKMNEDYTKYICLCTYPLDFVFHSGSLIDDFSLQSPDTYFKSIKDSSFVWITIINKGYLNYTRNFLKSMEINNVSFTLIIYCLDKEIISDLEKYKNAVCLDASYFIKGRLDPSFSGWGMVSYKTLVFSKLDALKYSLDLCKKYNIQCLGYIDTDIIVLKDPTPIMLNTLKDNPDVDIVNQCDEIAQLCSNDKLCASMCTGVIALRTSSIPGSLFDYCSDDTVHYMGDQDYIMDSIDKLGINRLSIHKHIFLNGMFPDLTTANPLVLPDTASLIHFNCMIGNKKEHNMKLKGMWYI